MSAASLSNEEIRLALDRARPRRKSFHHAPKARRQPARARAAPYPAGTALRTLLAFRDLDFQEGEVAQVADALELIASVSTVRRHLRRLTDAGLLDRQQPRRRPGDRAQGAVYALTLRGRMELRARGFNI